MKIKGIVRRETPEEKRIREAKKRGLRVKRQIFRFRLRKDEDR